ncbi:Hypoxia induced protein domain-containing protein [Dioscorea alata]|uniref:Hypoxia induced protein domain-containing protein n=1 Tax=Dioscorea alata TaxID=55571 RepID=A0ACB7VK12_DIOAL|nr:Hypoxia induced protein domain-containing protein [Dioscorea alata]
MQKMGVAEPQLEDLFKQLVPIGAFATAGVLTAGLISFRQGKSQLGQKLMRLVW